MLKLIAITAALSGLVFFFALAGLAYYSLPTPTNPSEQHTTTQTERQMSRQRWLLA
jgi:hypothetical protein